MKRLDAVEKDRHFAEAFKECADILIDRVNRGEDDVLFYAEFYVVPVAFLYRHSLELMLKAIIRVGVRLDFLADDEKLTELLCGHSLHKLWSKAKVAIHRRWPDQPGDELMATERIFQEFHGIDRSSQTFRYSTDKDGNDNLDKLPGVIDMRELKETAGAVFSFLSACEGSLQEALNMKFDGSD